MTGIFPVPICPFHGFMGIKMIQKSKFANLHEDLSESRWDVRYECPSCFFTCHFLQPMTVTEIEDAFNPWGNKKRKALSSTVETDQAPIGTQDNG